MRKLIDSSWTAQNIADKMEIEGSKSILEFNTKWNLLNTIHIIVNEADNKENDNIYYNYISFGSGFKRQIIICEIPSLIEKYGTDYDIDGMRNRIRGLSERCKDDEGNYIVSISTTHNLNYAIINDLDELLYQISII